ncbi:MAG TPA: universal stress protein [Gemmataceae bacterium]|nr:universal stress protein [Gemmataceae bacterium]
MDRATEIVNRAAELGSDLIVMGTHGRRGLNRVLSGSVAEEVMRRAARPVLTVKEADRPAKERPDASLGHGGAGDASKS